MSLAHHTIRELYRDAILVANCDAMANCSLVCFETKNQMKMDLAMDAFETRYGCQLNPPMQIDNENKLVGFWLPTVIRLIDQHYRISDINTDEGIYLQDETIRGRITFIQKSKNIDELKEKIPPAFDRAKVGRESPWLN